MTDVNKREPRFLPLRSTFPARCKGNCSNSTRIGCHGESSLPSPLFTYTLPLPRDSARLGGLRLGVVRQVTLSAAVFEKGEMVAGRADLGGASPEGSDLIWARWLIRPQVRDRRVLLAQVMPFATREASPPARCAPAFPGQVAPHTTTVHERLDGQAAVHTATPAAA